MRIGDASDRGEIRRFSCSRLGPSTGSRLLVTSIVIERSNIGRGNLSVCSLCRGVCGHLRIASCHLGVCGIVTRAMKDSIMGLGRMRFSCVRTISSLGFCSTHGIPRVGRRKVPTRIDRMGFADSLDSIRSILSNSSSFSCDGDPLCGDLFAPGGRRS